VTYKAIHFNPTNCGNTKTWVSISSGALGAAEQADISREVQVGIPNDAIYIPAIPKTDPTVAQLKPVQHLQRCVAAALRQYGKSCKNKTIQISYFVYSWLMPKAAESVNSLPGSVQVSLGVLGEHLRLGRKRRKESLRAWALRMNVSVPTLVAMERGDPRVSMGVYATALWLVGRDDALRTLAAPESDAQALAQELLVIQSKGRRRNV
jgi:hypothetical protein